MPKSRQAEDAISVCPRVVRNRERLAFLQDQLKQASNENIKRMRRSQIETAEADYERCVQELDGAMERADILAEPVAYGILTIEDM